eukprot:bmy_05497T0
MAKFMKLKSCISRVKVSLVKGSKETKKAAEVPIRRRKSPPGVLGDFREASLSRSYDKFIQTFNQSRVGKETDIHRVTHYVERILLPQWSTSLFIQCMQK